MTDVTKLLAPKTTVPTPQRPPSRGLIAVPPASLADDTVTVTLPSLSADYGWPCRWIRQADVIPTMRAECVVLWDEAGAGTVVWWAGAFVDLATQAEVDALETVARARVFNSTAISAATGTVVALTFDSERWDNAGLHSTGTNPGRLTASADGLWMVGANVRFQANATGYRYAQIRLNGTTIIAEDDRTNSGASLETTIPLGPTDWEMVAGDYVEVLVAQGSGSTLNIGAVPAYSPECWMHRVSG